MTKTVTTDISEAIIRPNTEAELALAATFVEQKAIEKGLNSSSAALELMFLPAGTIFI